MGSNESQIMKERFIFVILIVILKAFDGMIPRSRGDIESLFIFWRLHRDVVQEGSIQREEITLVLRIERSVESAIQHFAIYEPFSTVVVAIFIRSQILG